MTDMLLGKAAYDASLIASPCCHDGTPRRTWEQLDAVQQWSWNTTPREYPAAPNGRQPFSRATDFTLYLVNGLAIGSAIAVPALVFLAWLFWLVRK